MRQGYVFQEWLNQPVAATGAETTPCGDEASASACERGLGLGCRVALSPVTRRVVAAEVGYRDWNGDPET